MTVVQMLRRRYRVRFVSASYGGTGIRYPGAVLEWIVLKDDSQYSVLMLQWLVGDVVRMQS